MSVSEKSVEAKLRRKIEALGGLVLKLSPTSAVGLPDRIIILKDKVFFAEIKAGENTQSPAQKYWEKKIRSLGIGYFLINDKNINESVRFFSSQLSKTSHSQDKTE